MISIVGLGNAASAIAQISGTSHMAPGIGAFQVDPSAGNRLSLIHEAADSALRETLGLATEWIGDTFVSAAAQLPASSTGINRTLGFGAGPVAEVKTLVERLRFSMPGPA